MSKLEIRFIVLEFLKENPYTTIENIRNNVISAIKERGLEASKNDVLLINTIIWDMIMNRILTPGIDENNLDLPYIHVSNMDKLKNKLKEDIDL
ncbi:hypothetical protein [Sporosalibacterium faouarense]|uniref:hypothetical protein n=1 Tax=Sporosalibacterium faouarense TaxID=516123 RepID=UPI00141C0CDE|nr:hypothetical protein [Sporosalibacterium faouarense]MTI47052.1 hypothetical protein [Bacillota bacterium]